MVAKDSSDDDLNVTVPEELNKMDLTATECFRYDKRGYFARDCKSPPKDRKVSFEKGNYRSRYSGGKGSQTLYHTVEEEASDSNNDDNYSDYDILNPSDSDEDKEALDVLNSTWTNPLANPSDDDDSSSSDDSNDNRFYLMSTYEYNHDKTSVTKNDSLTSTKLLIYDLILNGEHSGKAVVDCGASTLCFNEMTAKSMGLEITKIKPRKVKIADKDMVMVTGYCTFEAKIEDLPKETITAYTFPLGSIDLILGLPWLQKHNPHTD